jgi:hypothetical protein
MAQANILEKREHPDTQYRIVSNKQLTRLKTTAIGE